MSVAVALPWELPRTETLGITRPRLGDALAGEGKGASY